MEQGAALSGNETDTFCAREIWTGCLPELRETVPSPFYGSLIEHLKPLSLDGGVLTLTAPNPFIKDIIEAKFLTKIAEAVSRLSKAKRVQINVIPSYGGNFESAKVIEKSPPRREDDLVAVPAGTGRTPLLPEKPSPKKYTFENFVVGDSNKLAYYASLMVAEAPGHNYNPLFIYGGTGLGKTHLLLAIEDYAKRLNPSIKVKYVPTSAFIDEFITTITLKKDRALFDQKYTQNKIILFDDIQALGGTDATQLKFFDIFNLLYGANSHIVLSSDRHPREIARLSDRIQSRFEGGLTVDIAPPDLETRLAILRMKSRAEGIEIPDDAMVYIASKVESNIRVLEGLFNRVVASARLYRIRIDLDMVQDVLKNQIPEPSRERTPTIDLILSLVSDYYNITSEEITGNSRSRNIVRARQIAMYLCRELTNETLISIGSRFGGRDHSTVLHSCKKIETMIKESRDVLQEINELTNIINHSD